LENRKEDISEEDDEIEENRKVPKDERFKLRYLGVMVNCGKFVAAYSSKKLGSYTYEEDAARAHDVAAIKDKGKDAMLNKIVTERTTIEDYFNTETITEDFIKSINTVLVLKEVFRAKPLWRKRISFSSICSRNFTEYKNIALKFLEEEKVLIDPIVEEEIIIPEVDIIPIGATSYSSETIYNIKTVKHIRHIFNDRRDWKNRLNVKIK
jgi:hypothetical protein